MHDKLQEDKMRGTGPQLEIRSLSNDEERPPRPQGRHFAGWRFWCLTAALPGIALFAISSLIRVFHLDLAVARAFYNPIGDYRWPGLASRFCRFMYDYGPWPGILIGVLALWTWFLSARRNPFSTSTRVCGFLSLVLLIAPGLIINLGLKNNWGRPRPSQIEQFGGTYSYAPLGVRGEGPSNGSFPSGHASIAFFVMAPGFLFLRRRRRLAAAFLTCGFAAGGLMGAVRIVQGAHFLSDVIWSGAIVYFTGLCLSQVLRIDDLEPGDLQVLPRILWRDTLGIFGRRNSESRVAPSAAPQNAEQQRRAA